jgi:hypothetical protein
LRGPRRVREPIPSVLWPLLPPVIVARHDEEAAAPSPAVLSGRQARLDSGPPVRVRNVVDIVHKVAILGERVPVVGPGGKVVQ